MIAGTLAFLLGILLVQQLPHLPPLMWAVVPAALFLPPLLLPHPWRRMALMPAGAAAGFLYAWLHAALTLGTPLPAALEGIDLWVEGVVASLPESDGERLRFVLDTARADEGAIPPRLRLAWYRPFPEVNAGERWRLQVRLKRPHGMANPGGFDYEGWLFQQGIGATGYVRAQADNRRLVDVPDSHPVQRLRQTLRERIGAALADEPQRGIIAALAVGDGQGIAAEQWRVFNLTGTTHLVAISGMHITLVAGMVFLLVRLLWAHWPQAALYLPAPQAAAWAALVAALLYAALAGFSVPTQRAVVMVAVAMGAVLLRRTLQPVHLLALALLAVLLLDPLAVLAPGFWLSFGAVALILYGMHGRLGAGGLWWRWGRVQWLIALGLAPLLVFWFQRVPILGPLANLIAVPWIEVLVVPVVLLGTLLLPLWNWLGTVLLQLAAWLLDGLWWLLEVLIVLLPTGWGVLAPPAWTLVPAMVGLLWLLAPRGWPVRWLGLFWLLPLAWVTPAVPAAGEVWVTLLDVGQGLATVVRTREHALVFDTGPRFSEEFDTGNAVVVPFLRQQGVAGVDVLMISHGDNDHIGGARSVVEEMPVGRVLTGVPHLMDWVAHEPCRRGQHWQWDGVDFEVLHPAAPGRGNDGSCVLRVATEGGSILLPGDIEAPAERELLRTVPERLAAQVLVAPHHGSKTSSTAEFIAAVGASHVLFPVGYRNRYRLPHPAVVERYRASGAHLLDSAGSGAITLRLGAGGTQWERHRLAARRYWHAP